MKRIILTSALIAGTAHYVSAQQNLLGFDTSRKDIPQIEVSDKNTINGECNVRNGLSNLNKKIKINTPLTIAFIGGSITQNGFCYRLQFAKFMEQKYPNVRFNWINAGVSGTGTDLGVFRVEEQVLSAKPDLVFIEFSVNGGYAPAMEGIIRKIKTNNPQTDICLLYSASESHMKTYQSGKLPDVVIEEEKLADHYNIPSIHMAKEAAILEHESKLIWKGKKDDTSGKIIFSTDGLHPTKAGGNIYASAMARSMETLLSEKGSENSLLPKPLYGTEWDNAKMFAPSEICKRHGLWKEVDASKDSRMKKFSDWFPTVMTSSHPGSTLSFAFDGDMFGIFDIGGPEMGQLEIYVDGQMIRLNKAKDGSFQYSEATDLTGTHYLNRFNRNCNNRYRGQHSLIKVTPGTHQVTIKLSDSKADKHKILGEKQLKDITENPEKYDKTYLMLGRILVRGNIVECNPVKGLPKMGQQLKWEKKIKDYMLRDEEQAALKDATLVVGSSSIDMWKSLENDFAGKNVIRRGISGTKAIDLYNYRNLLIEPFNPKRIIIYEGDNEIGFKWEIEEMIASMERLFFEIRRMKPEAEIYFVSVKPSPVRIKNLEKIQEFNRSLKEFIEKQPKAGYIDIHTPMLNDDGSVKNELYLKDGLHPSKEGYEIWKKEFSKIISK